MLAEGRSQRGYCMSTTLSRGLVALCVLGSAAMAVPGDVDRDGDVDSVDVRITQEYLGGDSTVFVNGQKYEWWDYFDFNAADVDGDGTVTFKDLSIIRQMALPLAVEKVTWADIKS